MTHERLPNACPPDADPSRTDLSRDIASLQGPILVLGASGFVGANLLRLLLDHRADCFGTASRDASWRLEGIPRDRIVVGDLLAGHNLVELLDAVRPRTVFNCLAHGAYSFETDVDLIYRTNLDLTARLVELLRRRDVHRYVHAGSSSEYGETAAAPDEEAALRPNSHYSVSKGAAAGLLHFAGRRHGFPCVNLRLYAIYGPYEDASRLVPTALMRALAGEAASYVDPSISRDFVFVTDACAAFVRAAAGLTPAHYGASFNIGSGRPTTIGAFARTVGALFALPGEPAFDMAPRAWDNTDWYADPRRAASELGWRAATPLAAGLEMTAAWLRALPDAGAYRNASKRFGADEVFSISAVIACYKDARAIPLMYERLKATFAGLGVAHEIIFVNDGSPDDSQEVIRALSERDRHVVGITHSRNFGSQAAFRSGMEAATKNACVLLDGDLQDPPELIEAFLAKWREGHDVVYGRRVKREAPWHMQLAYKAFYRVFSRMSYVTVPRDAGDFSLMDRRVVDCLLRFPERDAFLRGLRAFVGFRQVGVDYVRPERAFGVSTNNLFKNIGWAKKGLLSFSNTPLNMLSAAGVALFLLSIGLGAVTVLSKLCFPAAAPRGFTSLALVVIFFGSLNLLAASLIGEYIAKIFEEVKGRPHFIRRSFIRDGEVRTAGGAARTATGGGRGAEGADRRGPSRPN